VPPIIAVFIALQALAHGDTLVRGDGTIWKGVDPKVEHNRYETPVQYMVTTAPWKDRVADKRGGCDFQLLARVTGRGSMRARINMVEQLVDESWSPRFRIDEGERATFKVEFLEPAGEEAGYTVAERSAYFTCRPRDNRPVFRGNADLSRIQ
jgi:hypothetical protein